jgi:CII-binding regulator of phage lambda lysogenization HflD
MAATKDGAHLAHLADTVTALAEQLAEHGKVQQNILTVLNALLETNQAQSEMLADILGAASQDTGPSPVAEALEALAAQVQQMNENQTSLIAQVAELPEAIGRQFEASLKDWSTATATKH